MILPIDTKLPIDEESDEEDSYLPYEDFPDETVALTTGPYSYGYSQPSSPSSRISQLLLAQDDDLELGPAPPYTPVADPSSSVSWGRTSHWTRRSREDDRAQGRKRNKRKRRLLLAGAVAGMILGLLLLYINRDRKDWKHRPGRHGWDGRHPFPSEDELEGEVLKCVDMVDAQSLVVPLEGDGRFFAQMNGMGTGEVFVTQAEEEGGKGMEVVFEGGDGSACLFKRKRDGVTGLSIHSGTNWTTATSGTEEDDPYRIHLVLPKGDERPILLDLNTDSGNITLQDLKAITELKLKTGHGDVDLGNLRAELVKVELMGYTSGQVVVSDGLEVKSPVGDVDLNITLARPLNTPEMKCSKDHSAPPVDIVIHTGSGQASLRYLTSEVPCRRLRQNIFSLLGSVILYPDIAFEGPVHFTSSLGTINVTVPSNLSVNDPAGLGRNRTVTINDETTSEIVSGQVEWKPSISKHGKEEEWGIKVKSASGDITVAF
ncbi:hypothetical protein BCR39DRAFT_587582 [Naematelia encephala]|uniref:Uncharacterized protein n=1 Tax=Naematelia encephala TaxID=71784 RepID=A0A1Y2B8S5_9TREE|nr:hypothetical protein BCR39DRAFT_587582 [Naematelia encephala]